MAVFYSIFILLQSFLNKFENIMKNLPYVNKNKTNSRISKNIEMKLLYVLEFHIEIDFGLVR